MLKKYFSFFALSFLICIFVFANFSNAQDATSTPASEAQKLGFPYNVNFTEKEIKYLKSLPKTQLQKLINIAKMTLSKIKMPAPPKKVEVF